MSYDVDNLRNQNASDFQNNVFAQSLSMMLMVPGLRNALSEGVRKNTEDQQDCRLGGRDPPCISKSSNAGVLIRSPPKSDSREESRADSALNAARGRSAVTGGTRGPGAIPLSSRKTSLPRRQQIIACPKEQRPPVTLEGTSLQLDKSLNSIRERWIVVATILNEAVNRSSTHKRNRS